MNRLSLVAAVAVVSATPALAHVDPLEHGSLAAGMAHPLLGADHVLAMVGVGLLAVVVGGRALLALPAAFVGAMAAGYLAAVTGLQLPLVEPMILASVIVLGALVALATRLPLGGAAGLVAVFGLFHGAAHGGELGGASALTFALGFIVATAALHAAGVGLGLTVQRLSTSARGAAVLRVLGLATALGGAGLSVA